MLNLISSFKNRESSNFTSLLIKLSLVFVALASSSFSKDTTPLSTNTECDNLLSPALGYNAFIQYGVTVGSGDTEGPIAMGGDLTLNGTFTVAAHTGGTYFHNNESQAASLVVNGKIVYKSNQGINLNNGFVKIGDLTGSNVYDRDNNNVTTNTRISAGSYDQSPRIHLQRNQAYSSVNSGNIIDFNAAFIKLNAASFTYSQLSNNVTIENGNKITLANTINVLNLTGSQLNNLTNFTFNNKPTANSPLIINVNHTGDFAWNVQNQAGIGDQQGAFIIYNFYNSSKVIINGGGTIMGTLLAPSSDVEKKTSGNINGQVIAKSYNHLSGELHQHTYNYCEATICNLTVDAGNEQVVCENTLVTLSANSAGSACSENVTYTWSGPGIVGNTNQESITVDTAGTYTVKAQDCNECNAEDTVVVNINENPEVNVTTNNTSCTNQEGSIVFSFEDYQNRSHIKLSIDGGTTFVKVEDNIGSYTFNGLEANTYPISIKWGNNQCPLDLGAVIIEELQPITVDAGDNQEICLGETVTISAVMDIVSESQCSENISYLWSTGETTQNIDVSPTENTVYTVTASNCNSCTAEDTVLVTIKENPLAEVTAQNGTCTNPTDGSISFSFDAESPLSNIDLSIDGGLNFTTVDVALGSYTFESLAEGNYAIVIRNNENDCEITLQNVTIENPLPISVWDVNGDREICSGESTTLTAIVDPASVSECPEGITYLWSTGETTRSIDVSPTTNTEYTVTATSCNGCTDQDTVLVSINPLEVDAGDDVTIDFGQSETLSVSPFVEGAEYVWSTGETTPSITVTPTETTIYTVTATNMKGCSASDSITVDVITNPCLSEHYNVIAYPVPVAARGILNIDIAIDKDQVVNYTTYQMNGSRIGGSINLNLPKGCNTVNVDLAKHCSFATNTMYILQVTGEGWSESFNFITLP